MPFRVQAVNPNLAEVDTKNLSPTDARTRYANHICTFAGSVISCGFGKIVRIDLHPMVSDYLLAVPSEGEPRIVAWILLGYCTTSTNLTSHIGDIT